MSSWLSSDAIDASVTQSTPEIQTGQTLLGNSSSYSVLEFIGEGCFGKVARCLNLETRETVAVKILKKESDQDTEKEVSILTTINLLNPDLCNLVKFFERFEHVGQTCLAFEMLDRNLYDLLAEQEYEPMLPNEIRPIAKQLLVALDALKGLGVLHTDIKPDNVMLVDAWEQSLRVKLIDFGEAIPASHVQPGLDLQPTGYRAPEVSLGLPFTEAIDVWGVGCVLAFLYLADNLFPVTCDYQMMSCLVEILGQPEEHVLRAGLYTQYYFMQEEVADGTGWRLMTPEEYSSANDVEAGQPGRLFELPTSLGGLIDVYPKVEAAEYEDRRAFCDFLKHLLHVDGDQRICPREALLHQFITMSHLSETPDSRDYLEMSQVLMEVCPVDSADGVKTSAAAEPDPDAVVGPHGDTGHDRPDSRSIDGSGFTPGPCDEDPDWSSDGSGFTPGPCDEDPESSSDGSGFTPGPCDEDPDSSSDGLEAADSVSSGPFNKLLKSKFFRRIKAFFCWHPAVEN